MDKTALRQSVTHTGGFPKRGGKKKGAARQPFQLRAQHGMNEPPPGDSSFVRLRDRGKRDIGGN